MLSTIGLGVLLLYADALPAPASSALQRSQFKLEAQDRPAAVVGTSPGFLFDTVRSYRCRFPECNMIVGFVPASGVVNLQNGRAFNLANLPEDGSAPVFGEAFRGESTLERERLLQQTLASGLVPSIAGYDLSSFDRVRELPDHFIGAWVRRSPPHSSKIVMFRTDLAASDECQSRVVAELTERIDAVVSDFSYHGIAWTIALLREPGETDRLKMYRFTLFPSQVCRRAS